MRIALNALSAKIVASAAIVGTAAAVAGLGTFGTFTATTTASTTVAAGTVALSLGTPNTAANRLTVAAAGIDPGDTIQRAVDLTNSGSQGLTTISLTTTATTSSALDTTLGTGLQLTVDECSTPWTETAIGAGYTYTCGGALTTLLPITNVIVSGLPLLSVNALTAGGTDHLRVTMGLPVLAVNALQGLSSSIQFTFTGTQRAATTL